MYKCIIYIFCQCTHSTPSSLRAVKNKFVMASAQELIDTGDS
jgi:hypothetical protein